MKKYLILICLVLLPELSLAARGAYGDRRGAALGYRSSRGAALRLFFVVVVVGLFELCVEESCSSL